jgi:DNA-binding MarR family transcriptional regulator
MLSSQQLLCLTALARAGGKSPLSIDFLRESRINQPSSVKKALTRLVDLQIIYKGKDGYKFINPYFRAWLISENI